MRRNEASLTKPILTTDGRGLIEQPDGRYREAEHRTNRERLDAISEEDVERLADQDMQELGIGPDRTKHARPIYPPQKEPVTMRLDADIVAYRYFKRYVIASPSGAQP